MKLIRLLMILSSCTAKLTPGQIRDTVKKIGDPKISDSIMNPLFAFIFEANGGLHNMRFFGPTISGKTENGERVYAKDEAADGDSITDALIKLFPSSAGTITYMTSAKSNFANYFVEEVKNPGKKSDTLKSFANFFTAIAQGKDMFEDEGRLISKLKLQAIQNTDNKSSSDESNKPSPDESSKPKKQKKGEEKLSIPEKEGLTSLYKDKERDLKILLLNSFIVNVLDEKEDFEVYLRHVSANLGNAENPAKDENMESMLDKAVEIYNRLNFFPYSKINSPQSNIKISGYDRTVKQPLDKKNYGFSDCADVALLHLCNCLFYDGATNAYSLVHIKS